ncbi:aminotransferase class IV [Methylobacterium sp. SyP6R]|uniref:aminotransferase class IV n=1 Tax=Methylobacterium sp. SyP6R TaxID=2718876 RepID=UPI001F01E06E|nr:aminotransferase class IV [Methylobacterium sp. SyP6R]MCF4130033.1 aminotransferase class IV [Methylobacterium sp. SyP6R]
MSLVYLDGALIDASDARFGPSLFSLNYAVCAFEGIRCYAADGGSAVFRLREHLERYRRTCDFLGLESPYLDEDTQYRATMDLVRRFGGGDLYIRPIAFLDEGIMRLDEPPAPRSCIFAIPIPAPKPVPVIGLGVSTHPRSTETISRKISRNYFDSYLGLRSRLPGDDDLLFLDTNGKITETSAHNIFFFTNKGEVVTPTTTHCLPGITRDTVITLLRRGGTSVTERDIHVSEAAFFSAAFTTSTASEIRIVARIATTNFDAHHAKLRRLVDEFRRCTLGRDPECKEWNCYVQS